jgi:hypothetical protein
MTRYPALAKAAAWPYFIQLVSASDMKPCISNKGRPCPVSRHAISTPSAAWKLLHVIISYFFAFTNLTLGHHLLPRAFLSGKFFPVIIHSACNRLAYNKHSYYV